MKKVLLVIILAALALTLGTCSASAEEAPDISLKETLSDFENSILGQVTAIDGSTVTLQLGSIDALPGGMDFPEGAEPPEGMDFPGGAEPPEGMDFPGGAEPPEGMDFPGGAEPPEGMDFPEGAEPPADFEPGKPGHSPSGSDEQTPGAGPRSIPGFFTGEESETYVLDGLEINIHGDGSITEASISDIAVGDILIIVENEDNAPELVIIWRGQLMAAFPAPAPESKD